MKGQKYGYWLGFPPPQYLYNIREYKGVAINPPKFIPGSWCGAGKIIYDEARDEYLLTSRPRLSENDKRGYVAEIYGSKDGIKDFELVTSITKEKLSEFCEMKIHSIEGTQLLRDPLTNKWHFYLSIDVGDEMVWGGLFWKTYLLIADKLDGNWEPYGVVIDNGETYDKRQARDSSIDIIDGRYYSLYKAKDKDNKRRPALAISNDGKQWKKLGKLTIDGKDELAFLSGSLFNGTNGILFIGTEMIEQLDPNIPAKFADKHAVRHGSSMVNFSAYFLDVDNLNLDPIIRMPWEPLSDIEHKIHPLLGYSTSLFDAKNARFLMYVEVIDGEHTKEFGLNETVERVLVYESQL